MTRHHILKPPAINPLNTLIESRPITRAYRIPKQPFLPQCLPIRILQRPKNPRRPPRRRIHASLGILLSRRQIKQQIRFNERLARLVEEHQLLITVSVHEFVLELLVELAADFDLGFVLRGEDCGDRHVGHGFVGLGLCGPLLGESFGCDYVGGGEGGRPGGEEDVVLEVRGD
jgi:hypothetical protein